MSTESSSMRAVGKSLDSNDNESCGGDSGKGEMHDDQDAEEGIAQQKKVIGNTDVVTSTEDKRKCDSEMYERE
jgi:hypothetical protein